MYSCIVVIEVSEMNAKEFVTLESELRRLEWLNERMKEELNTDYGDSLRGYATLKGCMSVWVKELEKAIDQLKSLLNE